jgi:hypothetical protein
MGGCDSHMKQNLCLFAYLAFGLTFSQPVSAALAIPSDGSDGALDIQSVSTIDLSKAVTAAWDADNTAHAGEGVYDPNKWAVVFKYSSVNIRSGVAVDFANHPSHAPVVWLVNGDVTITGSLRLNGNSGTLPSQTPTLSEPGPGGFRGGGGDPRSDSPLRSSGFGPGGALDDHGQYGPGQARAYGNLMILPLIGGSGGSGGTYNGSAGGGAILIAASGTITITGDITANGGNNGSAFYKAGSGGAIRLVADQILGSGALRAVSTVNPGRIFLQGSVVSSTLTVDPIATVVPPEPLSIWPGERNPVVRVLSIGGKAAPADPKAALEVNRLADVTLFDSASATILLETKNFPVNGVVQVFIKPRQGPPTTVQATFVAGNSDLATWRIEQKLPAAYCSIQARAFIP